MSKVHNNIMSSRYELFAEGTAVLTLRYRMEGGQMWMLGMENSAPHKSHQNVDAFLIQVFKDVHRRRLEALPFCPTVRDFVMRNPTLLQLLPKETPGHFPDLHRAAALQQQRRKTLRASASQQKATTRKPDHVSIQNSRSEPVPTRVLDRNELNLAS